MAVLIGHASIDEHSKASGGTAGDQTGREVYIKNWYLYNGGWDYVLRPVSSSIAEASAKACEAGCANNKIGYDQSQRNTLHTLAKAKGYKLSAITEACETDCSAYMTVCAIAGGVTGLEYSGNAPTTSTMKSAFVNTGKYKLLTESKYRTSSDYLKRGDILVKSGHHTVMVLSNGSKASSSKSTSTSTSTKSKSTSSVSVEDASHMNKSLAGTYKTTAKLNMRTGAGTDKSIITQIPSGSHVINYGYFSVDDGIKWLYVTYTSNGKTYTGYCSSKYLKK